MGGITSDRNHRRGHESSVSLLSCPRCIVVPVAKGDGNTMRLALRELLAVAILFGVVASVRADVLLDDTWADGTRTNQNLPTDSAWWFSNKAATALTNSMFVPLTNNTADLGVTYFTDGDTNPVTLSLGDTLVISVKLTLSNVPPQNTLLGFRAGVVNFADSSLSPKRVSADGFSNGSQGSGVQGYALFQNMGTTFSDVFPMFIQKRTDLANGSLLGSIAAWTPMGIGPGNTNNFPGFSDGTEYVWQMTLQRLGTNSLAISTTWSNTTGGATISTAVTDNSATNFSFDGIALRPLNTNTAAAAYSFARVTVELVPSPKDGYANVGRTTTGGEGGPVVTVTDAVGLSNYINQAGSYVVQVKGTINLGVANFPMQANKTIIGFGTNATLIGDLHMVSVSNIIVRNLFISNPTSTGEGDGITIKTNVDHVWIDHCTFSDCADGELDITKASDYVTVSWCKFLYTSDTGHNFVNLIGADDADTIDQGKLHVTFHHNWYSTLCIERMPRVRFGRVHSYNNYFNAWVNGVITNNYCVRAALESEVLLEKNYFENVNTPWVKFITTGTPGLIQASSNELVNVTNQSDPGTDTVFIPPYFYTLDETAGLPAIVTTNAGAGRLGPGGSAFEQWQQLYFGCTSCSQASATADSDGDGADNASEFLAGTDPTDSASAFRITAITPEGNDIRVTWMMGDGKTNALERTSGTGGSYSTNNFAAIFTVTNTVGASTNYLDVGAATTFPVRYYRVRLVP